MRRLGLALALVVNIPAVAGADGPRLALDFLAALKMGEVERAKKLIDTRYVSPPGGADAFFRYESGYEPNLTFLVGQRFETGTPALITPIRSEWYVLDGTHGAHLAVPIRFEDTRAPFFLPSPLAFGRSMAFGDFMNFVKSPDRERYATLTLRIRPDVGARRITPPAPRVREAPPPPVGADPARRPMAPMTPGGGFEGGLLGRPQPRDPGAVMLPSGEALTQPQLEALLPRLRGITLHVNVMQRGRFASWRVEHMAVSDAVLLTHGVEIPLR